MQACKSKQGEPLSQVSTPDIMSANEYRQFWISWTGGVIRVGTGWVIDSNIFMQYLDPSPTPVNFVSVCGRYEEGPLPLYYSQDV